MSNGLPPLIKESLKISCPLRITFQNGPFRRHFLTCIDKDSHSRHESRLISFHNCARIPGQGLRMRKELLWFCLRCLNVCDLS